MTDNAQAPLILGIDIGTSGTKVALATADGRPVRDASATHRTAHPAPGQSEHDADTTWWEPITRLVREVLGDAADRVVSVSVSGLGPCVLVVDEDFRILFASFG
ncbi:FGGY family carbohydrate kinase, partial [Microbacterium sp. UCD-TDU]|uniref:FGGY family carbohydrate kinase n=1 Tax=Microbacterium sp. UCD-TDU TaxID=1247714 RepID=UPI0004CF0C58